MSITCECLKEIEEAIKASPTGISYEDLWKDCKNILDKEELSRGLHRLIQQYCIYKLNSIYYHVNINIDTDPVSANQKRILERQNRLLNTKLIQTEPACKEKIQVSLPYGELKRSKNTGALAYALWKFRKEEPLTTDELREITGCNTNVIYIALTKLTELGYITKDTTDRKNSLLKWSGKFRYPFDKFNDQDKNFIKFTPDKFVKNKIE